MPDKLNSPPEGYSYPKNTKNLIWEYFYQGDKVSGGRYIALCRYCQTTMHGKIPRMEVHLRRKCKAIPEEDRLKLPIYSFVNYTTICANAAQAASATSGSGSASAPATPYSVKKRKISMNGDLSTDFMGNYTEDYSSSLNGTELPEQIQNELIEKMCNAFISADIPWSAANDPKLKEFLVSLNPAFIPPSRSTLSALGDFKKKLIYTNPSYSNYEHINTQNTSEPKEIPNKPEEEST